MIALPILARMLSLKVVGGGERDISTAGLYSAIVKGLLERKEGKEGKFPDESPTAGSVRRNRS